MLSWPIGTIILKSFREHQIIFNTEAGEYVSFYLKVLCKFLATLGYEEAHIIMHHILLLSRICLYCAYTEHQETRHLVRMKGTPTEWKYLVCLFTALLRWLSVLAIYVPMNTTQANTKASLVPLHPSQKLSLVHWGLPGFHSQQFLRWLPGKWLHL